MSKCSTFGLFVKNSGIDVCLELQGSKLLSVPWNEQKYCGSSKEWYWNNIICKNIINSTDWQMLKIVSLACGKQCNMSWESMVKLSDTTLMTLWEHAAKYGLVVDGIAIKNSYNTCNVSLIRQKWAMTVKNTTSASEEVLGKKFIYSDTSLREFNSLKQIPSKSVGMPYVSLARMMCVLRLHPSKKHTQEYQPYLMNHKTGELTGQGIMKLQQYTRVNNVAQDKIREMEVMLLLLILAPNYNP